MRPLLLLTLLALAACIQPTLSKIDYRTYVIGSGAIPGGSDAPNRRLAEQVCPGGYRVLDERVHNGSPDRARHRPPGHAVDEQPVDPRRHRLSDLAPTVSLLQGAAHRQRIVQSVVTPGSSRARSGEPL